MIINPYVGMPVRCIKRIAQYEHLFNLCGVIKRIAESGVFDLAVDFTTHNGVRMFFDELEAIEAMHLSPEDTDRLRREHAMRFL